MAGKGAPRDPVSLLMDAPARRLLARAYKARGGWVGTRLADPSPRHLAYLEGLGIHPYGKDRPSAVAGHGLDARTRWARGFVRAVYYQHKWWSDGRGGFRRSKRTEPRHTGAIEVEIGRHLPAAGVIPAGRAVRIRIRRGGSVARRAVQRMPESERIFTDDGRLAARWSDRALRDWS